MKTRILCGLTGSILGFLTGYVFHVFNLSPLPFPLFFPAVFALVFAVVSFVVAERLFPVLLEVMIGFLTLGGGAILWHHLGQ